MIAFATPKLTANTILSLIHICIGGSDKVRTHLENLGFVEGEMVRVVSDISGNLIVQVKDARVAISRELATKILV